MQPIHELLSRIRHDREFGEGRFEIGCFDHREGTVSRVAFQAIVFPCGPGSVFACSMMAGREPGPVAKWAEREDYMLCSSVSSLWASISVERVVPTDTSLLGTPEPQSAQEAVC